jgi:hypothetical protein
MLTFVLGGILAKSLPIVVKHVPSSDYVSGTVVKFLVPRIEVHFELDRSTSLVEYCPEIEKTDEAQL